MPPTLVARGQTEWGGVWVGGRKLPQISSGIFHLRTNSGIPQDRTLPGVVTDLHLHAGLFPLHKNLEESDQSGIIWIILVAYKDRQVSTPKSDPWWSAKATNSSEHHMYFLCWIKNLIEFSFICLAPFTRIVYRCFTEVINPDPEPPGKYTGKEKPSFNRKKP